MWNWESSSRKNTTTSSTVEVVRGLCLCSSVAARRKTDMASGTPERSAIKEANRQLQEMHARMQTMEQQHQVALAAKERELDTLRVELRSAMVGVYACVCVCVCV